MVLFLFQPLPEYNWVTLLSLLYMSADLFGLLVGQPIRRGITG
jgi:hypothetical protein